MNTIDAKIEEALAGSVGKAQKLPNMGYTARCVQNGGGGRFHADSPTVLPVKENR